MELLDERRRRPGATTIGGWLRNTLNAILGRVSATPIQVLSLVQPGGLMEIEQYASYKAARATPWRSPSTCPST